jgi:hypothetical protein
VFDAAGLLQVGDLGLEQANAGLFQVDLPFDSGDLAAFAAGDGLGQVDAEDQHDQQAQRPNVDEAKTADPPIKQAHASSLQTGAVVRTAARSFAERERGLADTSVSDGP